MTALSDRCPSARLADAEVVMTTRKTSWSHFLAYASFRLLLQKETGFQVEKGLWSGVVKSEEGLVKLPHVSTVKSEEGLVKLPHVSTSPRPSGSKSKERVVAARDKHGYSSSRCRYTGLESSASHAERERTNSRRLWRSSQNYPDFHQQRQKSPARCSARAAQPGSLSLWCR